MSGFDFDGRPIAIPEGATVAAALLAAGLVAWRTTRVGRRPRGVLCGMGACHDCVLEVDGVRGVRVCLLPASDGMVVRSDPGPRS